MLPPQLFKETCQRIAGELEVEVSCYSVTTVVLSSGVRLWVGKNKIKNAYIVKKSEIKFFLPHRPALLLSASWCKYAHMLQCRIINQPLLASRAAGVTESMATLEVWFWGVGIFSDVIWCLNAERSVYEWQDESRLFSVPWGPNGATEWKAVFTLA